MKNQSVKDSIRQNFLIKLKSESVFTGVNLDKLNEIISMGENVNAMVLQIEALIGVGQNEDN